VHPAKRRLKYKKMQEIIVPKKQTTEKWARSWLTAQE
jgi:hypothetical protein